MLLVGPAGPVAIVGMYNWVARLGENELLVWHQPRGERQPVRFLAIRPSELPALKGDVGTRYPTARGAEPAVVMDRSPLAEFQLDTITVEEDLAASFPEPVCQLEELLLVCHA